MTIANWLFETMERLGKARVDSPRRDALVLLEDALGKDRAWVLAHPEYELDVKGSTFHTLQNNIERRLKREPLAYIRSKAWFYGRFFTVTPDVMIPRPESEAFISLLKEIVKGSTFHIVDVGTGSGCLAITAKLELPHVSVIATDINQSALEISKKNASDHKTDITFIQSDLLQNIELLQKPHDREKNVIVMANLPYVPEGMITSPEIKQEPTLALFSGKDGLDHYRRFWQEITELTNKPKYILTEALTEQHDSLAEIAKNAGYRLQKAEQLTQLFRLSIKPHLTQ